MLGGEHLKCPVYSFLPILRAQGCNDRALGTLQEQWCQVRSGVKEEGIWDRVTGTEGQTGQPPSLACAHCGPCS